MILHKLWFHMLLAAVCTADLQQMVRYFETLDSSDLQVVTRMKRTAAQTVLVSRHISFETLGKSFNLVLTPGSTVMGPNFKALTVDGHGKREAFFVDPNAFYSGFLEDDRAVEVDAHYEDGILSASVYFPNETYVVEPAWRHRLNSRNATMISYRRSDVNWEEIFPIDPKTGKRTRMNEGIRLQGETAGGSRPLTSKNEPYVAGTGKSRQKRMVKQNTCPLFVAADYSFFKKMGHKRRTITAAFIISTLQRINRYFVQTVWDSESGYVNMTVKIDFLVIHTAFDENHEHYNGPEPMGYKEMLYSFDQSTNLSTFCLGHLFTSYPFSDNVLGIAFTASDQLDIPGGICSLPTSTGPPTFRSGLSSTMNSRGEQVLSIQFELVVTHEIGHNWGSDHDPYTNECGPESKNNGKYVMWPIAVPGYEDNNRYFSPCSRRSVAVVLKSKSAYCFIEAHAMRTMCGNGMIELKEECDPGVLEEGEEDPCCNDRCQLREGAKCSDFNYECCRQCQPAAKSVLCDEQNELLCTGTSFCDGSRLECPEPNTLPDNTSCIDKGVCLSGKCVNFCDYQGRLIGKTLTPCLCAQNATAMCRRCCAEVLGKTKGECLPTHELLAAGRPCLVGFCDETGSCRKSLLVDNMRLFDFINHLNANKLAEFITTNLVGVVIVLSLVLWIPATIAIHMKDKQNSISRENEIRRKLTVEANPLHPLPSIYEASVSTAVAKQSAEQMSSATIPLITISVYNNDDKETKETQLGLI